MRKLILFIALLFPLISSAQLTTVIAGGYKVVSTLLPYTAFSPVNFATLSGNTATYTSLTDGGSGLGTLGLASGGVGIFQAQVNTFSLPGEINSGAIGYALNTNLFGVSNLVAYARVSNTGQLFAILHGNFYVSGTGVVPSGYWYRIRTDGVNFYVEYSADNITWVTWASEAQDSGHLYAQFNIDTSTGQRQVYNMYEQGLN